MLEILVFAFGIMYTPGPANTLSLLAGINGQGVRALRFCLGVGIAMLMLFLLIGYLGSGVIPLKYQSYVAIIGGLYIAYLGFKIMRASFQQKGIQSKAALLDFKTGLLLQLSNPKALVAILPIVTVQFPRFHIVGEQIALWSFLLGVMAFGAPSVYWLLGTRVKRAALNPNIMAWVNRLMALLLWFVAYQFIVGI